MNSLKQGQIGRVLVELWGSSAATSETYVQSTHALLETGAGEEEVVEQLSRMEIELLGLRQRSLENLVPAARALLKIGVRPKTTGWRQHKMDDCRCSVCREIDGSTRGTIWGCACGFRICQVCVAENSWGLTCNGITWECPDCGRFRSF